MRRHPVFKAACLLAIAFLVGLHLEFGWESYHPSLLAAPKVVAPSPDHPRPYRH